MAWQYHIENIQVAERWSPKKQASEIANLKLRLDTLGHEDWEMVGFESIPLVGGITGNQKGFAYLMFFKRQVKDS